MGNKVELSREPQTRAPFPVGADVIKKTLSPLTLDNLPQATEQEIKFVRGANLHFANYLDRFFELYRENAGITTDGATLAHNSYIDGAMLVHRLLRVQGSARMPVFSETEPAQVLKAEHTAMRQYAEEQGARDTDTERIAYGRISRLGIDQGEIDLEVALLQQAGQVKDPKPFLVGSMAAYFGLKAAWIDREMSRAAKEQERKAIRQERRAIAQLVRANRSAISEIDQSYRAMQAVYDRKLDQPEQVAEAGQPVPPAQQFAVWERQFN